MPDSVSLYLTLPFVNRDNGVLNFWAPDRSGDFELQCKRGRGYAEAFMDVVHQHGRPELAGYVLRAFQAAGMWEGVEIGFCHRLGIMIVVDHCPRPVVVPFTEAVEAAAA